MRAHGNLSWRWRQIAWIRIRSFPTLISPVISNYCKNRKYVRKRSWGAPWDKLDTWLRFFIYVFLKHPIIDLLRSRRLSLRLSAADWGVRFKNSRNLSFLIGQNQPTWPNAIWGLLVYILFFFLMGQDSRVLICDFHSILKLDLVPNFDDFSLLMLT